MHTTLPCPVCQHTITCIVTSPALACPFCRAEIPSTKHGIPAGGKVQCGQCRGVFTAEVPPAGIRVFASVQETCPFCEAPLVIRKDRPAGKKVRCPQCRKTFRPAPRPDPAALPPPPQELRSTYNFLAGDHPVAPLPPRPADTHPPETAPVQRLPVHAPVHEPTAPADSPPPPVAAHRAAAPAVAPLPPVVSPKSSTRFGPPSSPGSKMTHLAPHPPEESEPHEAPPAVPPPADEVVELSGEQDEAEPVSEDEVQLLGDNLNFGFEMPPEPPPPHEEPEPALAPLPKTLRVPKPHPPQQLPAHAEEAPASAAAKKKHAPAARAAKPKPPPPAEPEPAPEPEPAMANGQSSPGLVGVQAMSSQSLDRAVADALLEETEAAEEEPDAEDVEDAEELTPEPAAKATAKPEVKAPPHRPFIPALPPPQPAARPALRQPVASSGGGVEIDFKKLAKYALPALVLVAAIYYFFFTDGPERLPVQPVEGVVFFAGKPATGARITLYPEVQATKRYFPSAVVGEDGSFKLTTYEPNDGAPAGRYVVTVVRGQMDAGQFQELSKKFSPEEARRKYDEMARDPLFNKYANTRSSKLTAEITPGQPSRLEFRLE